MSSCCIQIRVLPNAKREGWVGMWNGTHYKVALRAPAVDGKANEALIDFLADFFHLPKRSVVLISGQTNRLKVVQLQGIDQNQLPNL